MTRIPVVLVTGFLGSGKTTLLRRIAALHPDRRMVFLVNEFADVDVDGADLQQSGTPTHSVIGGSLFCECKAGDFIRVLQEEVLPYHLQAALELLVIETSGTADPEAIGELMSLHGLADHFVLCRITTVVAPKTFARLLNNLPVVEVQIRSSDLILINKIDTVDDGALAATEQAIRSINSSATIERCSYCDLSFDLSTLMQLPSLPNGQLSTCEANPFSTAHGFWPSECSIELARTWLQELPQTILRVKGSITTPEGTWHIQRTVDGLAITESPLSAGGLVLIAHDDHEADLEQAVSRLNPSQNPA